MFFISIAVLKIKCLARTSSVAILSTSGQTRRYNKKGAPVTPPLNPEYG
jgi:hypothetical protein